MSKGLMRLIGNRFPQCLDHPPTGYDGWEGWSPL
jgi:hypothetical protein